MNKSWSLAILLGVLALIIGGALLMTGRLGGEPANAMYKPKTYDGALMLNLTETLASDAMKGRAPGTPESEAARNFVKKRFQTFGVRAFDDDYFQSFSVPNMRDAEAPPVEGTNVIGYLPGKRGENGPVLVISAHYDHVGVKDGEIYNGADDNASGTAALTAAAEFFSNNPPEHDVIFAAFDAEETGLSGARAFVRNPPFALERIAMNINMDMVGRSEPGILWASGTYHWPQLAGLVAAVAEDAPATLKMGHDTPEEGINDWTLQSDHAVFYRAGIPHLYLGVEDHPGYHNPSDDYAELTHDFFLRSVETVVLLADAADTELSKITQLAKIPEDLEAPNE